MREFGPCSLNGCRRAPSDLPRGLVHEEVPHHFGLNAGERKKRTTEKPAWGTWHMDEDVGNCGTCSAKHGLMGDAWDAEM